MNESFENGEKTMATQDLFRVTIAFTDSDVDDREAEALKLLPQLKDLGEVESVERVATVTPEGGKGLGFLPGWLVAQVNVENGKKVLGFLGNRLAGKSIELEVEGNGRKLKVKASSPEELRLVIAQAEQFIKG
jgi:hypothetical protein